MFPGMHTQQQLFLDRRPYGGTRTSYLLLNLIWSGRAFLSTFLYACESWISKTELEIEDPCPWDEMLSETSEHVLQRSWTKGDSQQVQDALCVHDDLAHWVHDDLAHWVHDDLAHWVHDDLAHWVHDVLAHWVHDDLAHWVHDDRMMISHTECMMISHIECMMFSHTECMMISQIECMMISHIECIMISHSWVHEDLLTVVRKATTHMVWLHFKTL